MKTCPNCSTLNSDVNFCKACGCRLPDQTEIAQINEDVFGSDVSFPDYNEQPVVQEKKNNCKKNVIAIIVIILVLAVIGTGVYFYFFKDKENTDRDDDIIFEDEDIFAEEESSIVYYEPEVETEEPESTTIDETTTVAVANPEEAAYLAFFDFYNSYLEGINSLDSGTINFCSPDVKAEMVKRFQFNRNSLFDLIRIDYDLDSFAAVSDVNGNEYSFYVKCVSKMYDRDTNVEKEMNYAVWNVTVTETANNFIISKMERDDEYEMSSNLKILNDAVSIF